MIWLCTLSPPADRLSALVMNGFCCAAKSTSHNSTRLTPHALYAFADNHVAAHGIHLDLAAAVAADVAAVLD